MKKIPVPNQGQAPCPSCLRLARAGTLRLETIMPTPPAPPTLKADGRPCCHDCQSAETIARIGMVPTFEMARIAVANDRQEQFRLPGAPMGLVQARLMRPRAPGDLERHLAWLEANDYFGLNVEE